MAATIAVENNKVAGFVDGGYNRRNRQRIEEQEKELEELTKGSVVVEPEQDEKVVEEEDKPLTREEESFKKRYGDLRRHMSDKEKEFQKQIDDLKSQLQGSTVIPPKSDEDIDAWVKSHPEVAAIVKALAAREAQQKFSGAEDRLKKIDEERQEITRQKAETTIKAKHEDFDEVKVSDEFHDWAESQPKWIQDAVYDNPDDPQALIRVLDLYKADKGLDKKSQKQASREAASVIKTRVKPDFDQSEGKFEYSESQIAKMSDREYEKLEDKITEAIRSGRFNYDLSGAAR